MIPMKDVYAEAKGIADKIMKRTNEKYAAEWPFLNDTEFEEVTEGIISVSDNSHCLTYCRDICCPKECVFYSDKLDSCGIYDFRSASCRFFFCEDSEYQAVLKKVHKAFCSEVTFQTANDIVESEVDGKESSFGRLLDSAKIVKENLESSKIPLEDAKSEWRTIIQEYRNRKV